MPSRLLKVYWRFMSNLNSFVEITLDLLTYYQHGNDTSLKAILEKATYHSHWHNQKSKFWYYNARLALEIGGFLEITETTSGSQWYFISKNPIIKSKNNVTILGSQKSLLEFDQSITPEAMITTDEGFSFYGFSRQADSDCELVSIQGQIISHLPTYVEVEKSVCEVVRGSPDVSISQWEYFDFQNFKWIEFESTENVRKGLFRTWDPAAGRSYWIYDGLSKSTKVIHPEWAMLLAVKKLDIDIGTVFNVVGNDLIIPRAFKLPRLIQKELFMHCKNVKIDWNLTFCGIDINFHKTLLEVFEKKEFC